MKTVDVTRTLDAYRSHADYTPETLAKAEEILVGARQRLSGASQLGTLVLDVCYMAWTTRVDTFAVTLGADAFPILLVNPNFMVDLMETTKKGVSLQSGGVTIEDDSGVVFVLMHEATHLFLKHLKRGEFSDELGEMAAESTINYFVSQLLKQSGISGAWSQPRWMPSTPKLKVDGGVAKDSTGNPTRKRTGVDPWKTFADYAKALKDAGDTPVSIEVFYSSDSECLRQLKRMPTPPSPPSRSCEHGVDSDSLSGESGTPGAPKAPGVELDSGAVDEVVGEVLRQAIIKAVQGGSESRIRGELLQLADITPEASKIWGDLGLGTLRGEATVTRRVDWWVQWVSNQVASRLFESNRLVWERSIVWETRLGYVGDDDRHQAVIAIDTSGSMPESLITELSNLVGTNEQMDVTWIAFDGQVWPFQPGQSMQGGGGTSFQVIDDYLLTLEEPPDVVIVATDGYAAPITPREPEKWVWLITPGGSEWPATHDVPMSSFPLRLPT